MIHHVDVQLKEVEAVSESEAAALQASTDLAVVAHRA